MGGAKVGTLTTPTQDILDRETCPCLTRFHRELLTPSDRRYMTARTRARARAVSSRIPRYDHRARLKNRHNYNLESSIQPSLWVIEDRLTLRAIQVSILSSYRINFHGNRFHGYTRTLLRTSLAILSRHPNITPQAHLVSGSGSQRRYQASLSHTRTSFQKNCLPNLFKFIRFTRALGMTCSTNVCLRKRNASRRWEEHDCMAL